MCMVSLLQKNTARSFIDTLTSGYARASLLLCDSSSLQDLKLDGESRSLYQAKDALPPEATTHTVYSVTCKTCSAEYIDKTQRTLRVCGNEHHDAVHRGHCSKLAVAEHVHNYEVLHEVDWNSLKVEDKSKNCAERKV